MFIHKLFISIRFEGSTKGNLNVIFIMTLKKRKGKRKTLYIIMPDVHKHFMHASSAGAVT